MKTVYAILIAVVLVAGCQVTSQRAVDQPDRLIQAVCCCEMFGWPQPAIVDGVPLCATDLRDETCEAVLREISQRWLGEQKECER